MPATIVALTVFFVHFTDAVSAASIASSGVLRKGSFGGVFAVVEGGAFVPGVQLTELGVAADRSVAVVFRCHLRPDTAFPEEVIWHCDEIPVVVEEILPAADAAEALLDDTAPRNDDDTLVMDLHPSTRSWEGGTVRL